MAMIHGKAGAVSFTSGEFTEVVNWSINATCDTAETTAMDAAVYWKTRLAGFKDWTASVDCKYNGTGLAALGGSATLTLTLVAGTTIAGTGICTGYGLTTDANDVITQHYEFVGNGALT